MVAGNQTVECKPQGVSKAVAVARLLSVFGAQGGFGFALCVGDDKSDEEMYVVLEQAVEESRVIQPDGLFSCTVGQKPSKAPYYLNDPSEVLELLQNLAGGDKGGAH